MATVPVPQPATASIGGSARPVEFRSSAAFPLPVLRPVPDFVALPSTGRYVTVQGKFALALGAAACWLVLVGAAAFRVVPAEQDVVPWPIAAMLLVLVVALPGA